MPWVLWITGLPGSGKSTVASAVKEKTPDSVMIRMDELRRIVTPQPTYSDSEREYVYRSLVYTAKTLYENGHTVIIDATGNRKAWRELARKLIASFIEVYLQCPIEICEKREGARIDTHAAPRKIVPGINVPYEESERPDITIIDTEKDSPADATEKIMNVLKRWEIKQ
jgi:adenylylsulfate kinase